MTRAEKYAKWTLPFLFPMTGSNEGSEHQVSTDGIGARAVNHVSNKVVTTLFRPQGPFFRLRLSKQQRKQIALLAQSSDQAKVAELTQRIEQELNDTEQEAVEHLDMVAYRPMATNAAQLLVATGNALVYHPAGKPVQVFTLRDYCVVRDLSGTVIEIMTRECKAFETFHPDVQIQLRVRDYGRQDTDEVKVYTQIKLHEDGKFHARQEAGGVELDIEDAMWPAKLLPWIPLTWNLLRGEDYGRGLVEDYAGAFHALSVLTQSLVNLAAIMGDIKFFVKPTSVIDVAELNKSPAGSYHSGNAEDVAAMQTNKNSDANFIVSMIERYERQIAQAFLLNSSVTRDAERVTAEEIRIQANELEMSVGGIYSRLALQWQVPTANVTLDHIGFSGLEQGITPQIITGMDSLSRAGELDNLRMFVSDMALLEAVPEDFRRAIDPLKFAAVIGTARQVDYAKFMKSAEQMQAEIQQEQAALANQEQMKAAGAVASEAGKAAVQSQG